MSPPLTLRVAGRAGPTGITAKEAAAESYQLAELTPFVDRAQAGVSRTLCQGLSRLGGTGYRPFEVGFGWAGAVPTQPPDSTVRFETEQVAMLGHAAEDLGRASLDEQAEMRGKVRAMERNDPQEQGWVVVRGTLTTGNTSRQRQVWVPLDAGDYDRALRAHGQGLDVRLAGTLTRTGRRAELNPHRLLPRPLTDIHGNPVGLGHGWPPGGKGPGVGQALGQCLGGSAAGSRTVKR